MVKATKCIGFFLLLLAPVFTAQAYKLKIKKAPLPTGQYIHFRDDIQYSLNAVVGEYEEKPEMIGEKCQLGLYIETDDEGNRHEYTTGKIEYIGRHDDAADQKSVVRFVGRTEEKIAPGRIAKSDCPTRALFLVDEQEVLRLAKYEKEQIDHENLVQQKKADIKSFVDETLEFNHYDVNKKCYLEGSKEPWDGKTWLCDPMSKEVKAKVRNAKYRKPVIQFEQPNQNPAQDPTNATAK